MGASVKKTKLVPRKRKKDEEVMETIEIEDDADDGREVESQPGIGKGDGASQRKTSHTVSYPGSSGHPFSSPRSSGHPITSQGFSGHPVTSSSGPGYSGHPVTSSPGPGYSGHPVTSSPGPGYYGHPATYPGYSGHPAWSPNLLPAHSSHGHPATYPGYSGHPAWSPNLLPAHSSHLGQIGAMAMSSLAKSIMEGAAPMLNTLLHANLQVTRELSVKTGDGEFEKTVKVTFTF